jgi:NTE family protein
VLSAGGLRGAAHLGVLRRLRAEGVPLQVMVGASAGAIISAFHAAVGLSIDEMIEEAKTFQGRHLLFHALGLRLPEALKRRVGPYCGVIPQRLKELEEARFDRLSHGVGALGIVCHDVRRWKPVYFHSGDGYGMPLSPIVRASAAIPVLMPSRRVVHGDHRFHLTDGGVSDPLPTAFARTAPLGATHLIVSDCRDRPDARMAASEDVIYLHHPLKTVGSLRSPRESLMRAVDEGERSVTPEALVTIRGWVACL